MNNPIVVDLLTVARKLDNYQLDATSGGLWDSTTNFIVTVPAKKRWFLFGGNVSRGVSSTMYAYVKDSDDNIILMLAYHAAAAAAAAYPLAANTGNVVFPYPMDPGDYVNLLFGVAQNASSYASCVVLEVDV